MGIKDFPFFRNDLVSCTSYPLLARLSILKYPGKGEATLGGSEEGTLLTKNNSGIKEELFGRTFQEGDVLLGAQDFFPPLFFYPCSQESFQQLFGTSLLSLDT